MQFETTALTAKPRGKDLIAKCPYCKSEARGTEQMRRTYYSCTHVYCSIWNPEEYGGLLVFFRRKIGD